MKPTSDEIFVVDLFRDRFGIELRSIPQVLESPESPGQRTPDFEMWSSGSLAGVCELKTITAPPWGDMAEFQRRGWTINLSDDGAWSAERELNAAGKLGDLIHDARVQLEQRERPRCVILLNDSPTVDIRDLDEILFDRSPHPPFTGIEGLTIEIRSKGSSRVAAGRLQSDKQEIDLIVWIDRARQNSVYARATTPMGEMTAANLGFGV